MTRLRTIGQRVDVADGRALILIGAALGALGAVIAQLFWWVLRIL